MAIGYTVILAHWLKKVVILLMHMTGNVWPVRTINLESWRPPVPTQLAQGGSVSE